MKQSFSIDRILLGALLAVALLGVAAVAFNYQGLVDFNLGSDGINLQINGGEQAD